MATVRRASTKTRRKPSAPAHARPARGNAPTARLRKICLALSRRDREGRVGRAHLARRRKLFAQMDTHHHGADHIAVWLPMPLGAQEALVESDAGGSSFRRTSGIVAGWACASIAIRNGA
jgi:hypothetical protein